jgi:hypothetical protein
MFDPNAEPIIYEIWIKRPEIEIWGTRRQDFQTEQVSRFPFCSRFNSSVGRWIIVSNDVEITNDQAIEFARAVAARKVKTFHIDLASVQP